MKKLVFTLIFIFAMAFSTPVETSASGSASSVSAQTTKGKKVSSKAGTKKKAAAKKYTPMSIGDCFIGERIRKPNTSGLWCEITFYPNGTCELKMENSSLKGTFTGTVTGSKYKISVKFNNGEEYDFVGTKSRLVADDGLVKYVVSEEM